MWSIKLKRFCIAALLTSATSQPVFASFLDSDFYCRTYGCAVVHDGQNYDIYDNWRFDTNSCCVPFGGQMVDYYTRAGNTNLTETLNRAFTYRAETDESMMLGVTQNGNISERIFDDGDGYLDADDILGQFKLNTNTDIRLDGRGRQYSHSFFISSRNTRFSVRALASIANASGDFAQTVALEDIKLTPSVDRRGNDSGFDYGRRARTNNTTIFGGINDLGDLAGTPAKIFEFRDNRGIRINNGDIDEQTLRLDFLYTMPEYDLSMGVGALDVDVVFDFYRER